MFCSWLVVKNSPLLAHFCYTLLLVCIYQIMEELSVKHQESSLLQQEKENIFAELKESRMEVARLTENKDNLKRDLSKLKSAHAKEVNKLHAQLKGKLSKLSAISLLISALLMRFFIIVSNNTVPHY